MKEHRNQLRTGVVLSYLNLGISCVIPLIYTPIMLRMLGQAEYGLYSLANSVISYLTLLTFGFGTTITRYLSKYRAEGNKTAVEKTVGLFLALYGAVALLVLVVGTVVSFNVEPIFQKGLTEAEIEKVHILILIMTFNTALSFPLSVFSSVITSYEKFIYRKLVDMISTVAAPVFNLIALYLGFASVGMALASTALQILMLPLNVGYCLRVLGVRPRFGKVEGQLLKEMLGFSVYVFLGTLVDLLFWSTDKIILGMLAGSVAVAVYNVGGTFNQMVINLSTSISGVLTPRITGMVVLNRPREEISDLFIRVGRLQYLVIALIISGFTVFGQTFIRLWAGTEYAEAYWIAILTMFPLCIPLIQNTGVSIITAQNKHKFRSLVYLAIAVLNVISTYLIVPYLGGIGAALCSCLSYLLGQGLIMNLYYYKVTQIDIPRFWKNIGSMSVVPALLMAAGLGWNHFFTLDGWGEFLAGVIVFAAVYCLLMYKTSMNSYEKNVVRAPVCKLCTKLGFGKETR